MCFYGASPEESNTAWFKFSTKVKEVKKLDIVVSVADMKAAYGKK